MIYPDGDYMKAREKPMPYPEDLVNQTNQNEMLLKTAEAKYHEASKAYHESLLAVAEAQEKVSLHNTSVRIAQQGNSEEILRNSSQLLDDAIENFHELTAKASAKSNFANMMLMNLTATSHIVACRQRIIESKVLLTKTIEESYRESGDK